MSFYIMNHIQFTSVYCLKLGRFDYKIRLKKTIAVIKYNVFIFKNIIISMDQTTQIKNSKTTFAGLS